MNSLKFSFILLTLLSACRQIPEARVAVTSSTQSTSTSTASAEPSATPTAPDSSPETPIPPTPTQVAIEFPRELPATMEGFTDIGSESNFKNVLSVLRATETPFGPEVPPVDVQVVTDGVGGAPKEVTLVCNEGDIKNCIPVAFVKFGEYYVVVLKIKNLDGTTGYFPWSIAGGLNSYVPQDELFLRIQKRPLGLRNIHIPVSMAEPSAKDGNPIYVDFVNNPTNVQAMLDFAETDTFPIDFEDIIPANSQ